MVTSCLLLTSYTIRLYSLVSSTNYNFISIYLVCIQLAQSYTRFYDSVPQTEYYQS